MVFAALVTAWRLAIWPTRRSPLSVKPTTLGVVRPPSLFATICTVPPSSTATQQFVVPKSIPMILPMRFHRLSLFFIIQGFGARCHFDHCRPQQSIANAIAALHLGYNRVRFVLVGSFSYDRFVYVRIKTLAHGGNRLDAEGLQHLVQLLADQFNPVQEMPELFRLAGFD